MWQYLRATYYILHIHKSCVEIVKSLKLGQWDMRKFEQIELQEDDI